MKEENNNYQLDSDQEEPKIYHKPVLVQEVLHYLDPKPGGVYLDVTFGSGGHTRAILEKEPTCKVIAMDWDTVALDTYGPPLQQMFPERLRLIWGNFALLYKILKKEKIDKVDVFSCFFALEQLHVQYVLNIFLHPTDEIFDITFLLMRLLLFFLPLSADEQVTYAYQALHPCATKIQDGL